MRKIAAAGVLMLTLVFPSNGHGAVNIIDCSGEVNTFEGYNKGLKVQRTPTNSYNLGFTAICIGMYEKGIINLTMQYKYNKGYCFHPTLHLYNPS